MSQHGCPERLSNRSKGFQEDGASQPTMEVLVETLTGTAFEMTVSPSDTIFAIKSKICRVEGIPVSQQHLLYNLTELEDGMSLRALGIADGARLRLVLGMRGGPISTRRLPPPPGEPWRDIERLLDSNRDEGWSGGGSGSGSGCKVTVLVFRDGERVNMLRVRENRDGSYSPIEHTKYVSDAPSLSHAAARPATEQSGALQQNAVTQGKMLDLRRRMESLSVRRRVDVPGEKPEIQKTRSEETLSVPSLLDDGSNEPFNRTYTPYSEAEDTFTPLYDGNYTRYEYDCSFADRYTLLPPIGTRTDSEQSIQEESDRLKLSDALAGSILVKGRREREDEAILEECLEGVEECHIRQDSPQLAAKNLAPIPAAEYGAVVGGSGSGSGAGSGSGSGSWLGALGGPPAHAHSASSLHVRARNTHSHPHTHTHAHAHAHPHARVQPLPLPLADALFSSSTSDLEKLRRNSRILPTLSRHRNREHLHLSDEGLDRHEPRHIHNIAEMDSRLFRFGDLDHGHKEPQPEPQPAEHVPEITQDTTKDKKIRIRCGFCRKRLSIATVHRCRCGAVFCAPHRYAEVHGCAYDYKAAALKALAQANPLVSAPKLPKI